MDTLSTEVISEMLEIFLSLYRLLFFHPEKTADPGMI